MPKRRDIMYREFSIELGGRKLTLEFGKYAEQASGSTFVRYGDTCVLVNATVAAAPLPGSDTGANSAPRPAALHARQMP